MIASANGYIELVEILIQNGASITLRDNRGLNAFDYSKLYGQT